RQRPTPLRKFVVTGPTAPASKHLRRKPRTMETLFNGWVAGITTREDFDARLHRTAVDYLLHIEDTGAAMALLPSALRTEYGNQDLSPDWVINAIVSAPPAIYTALDDENTFIAIRDAVAACVPHGVWLQEVCREIRLLHVD